MDRNPYAAPDCGAPLAPPAPEPDPTTTALAPLLVRAAIATLGGLLLGCLLVVGAVLAYVSVSYPWHGGRPHSLAEKGGGVLVLALVAAVIGGVPALLVGAPGYALLVRRGWANAWTVALLGAAPGLLLLAFQVGTAVVFVVFGVVVALVTHALFWWGSRRDRSTT